MRRRGTFKENANPAVMAAAFEKHLSEVDAWFDGRSYVKMMRVPYKDVLSKPQEISRQAATFLGVELNLAAMVAQVDESLYRNRAK